MIHLTYRRIRGYFLVGSVVAVLMLWTMSYVVVEGESVIVTRLGRPVTLVDTPGLRWKLPTPIDRLHRIDRRLQHFALSPRTLFTRDKRQVVLTTFVIWHVEDPMRLLQSVQGSGAAASLDSLTLAAEGEQIAQRPLDALITTDPQKVQVAEIEKAIAEQVDRIAAKRLGVRVDQVGIEKISFPPANLDAVLARMRAEREAEANRLRAEGSRQAQSIRDDAHVRSQETLRAGREQASQILANGETEAARLLHQAHAEDPELFEFWTALQASKRVLQENATLIFSTDQLFFRSLLTDSPHDMSPRSSLPASSATKSASSELVKP